MVAAWEWQRRERQHSAEMLAEHSRKYGITSSPSYAAAKIRAGIR
jgi:hypothetical protein